MSDAITKFTNKLSEKERLVVFNTIKKIISDDLIGLEIKKLTGYTDLFRVRKGKFRIIYRKESNDCTIISVNRRNESTYTDF